MASVKSTREFLSLTESHLFSFQLILSPSDLPFYFGQDNHISPLLHLCSVWINWRKGWWVLAFMAFAVASPFELTSWFNSCTLLTPLCSWTPKQPSMHCGTVVYLLHMGQWELIFWMFPHLTIKGIEFAVMYLKDWCSKLLAYEQFKTDPHFTIAPRWYQTFGHKNSPNNLGRATLF